MMIDYLKAVEICAKLKDKKIRYINRSLNLIDIGFGDVFERVGTSGKSRMVATYALHIQCPFRLLYQGRIITGSEDMYVSPNDKVDIDMNEQNNSIFDNKINEIKHNFSEEYVRDIKLNVFGDLEIKSLNFCILVFVANSGDYEAWRFFRVNKNEKHLVISGNKFELQ